MSSAMRRLALASSIQTRNSRLTSDGPKLRAMTTGAGSSLTPSTPRAMSTSSDFARSMSDSYATENGILKPDVLAGHRVVDDVAQHELTVRDDDDEIVGIPDLRGPEPDLDHVAPGPRLVGCGPEFDPVPDLEGAVDDEEHSRDHVGERVLGGERKGESHDAGAGEERRDVDAQLREREDDAEGR